MHILRGLEAVFGIAAGAAWGWRVQHLATSPIYCYASSTGAHGCAGLFDPPSSYVLTLVVLASAVFLTGIAAAILHSLTGRPVWRKALWIAAVLLVAFSLLGILTLGWETLPSAALPLLAALCSLGVHGQPVDGRA